jgi:hypothetical protein
MGLADRVIELDFGEQKVLIRGMPAVSHELRSGKLQQFRTRERLMVVPRLFLNLSPKKHMEVVDHDFQTLGYRPHVHGHTRTHFGSKGNAQN